VLLTEKIETLQEEVEMLKSSNWRFSCGQDTYKQKAFKKLTHLFSRWFLIAFKLSLRDVFIYLFAWTSRGRLVGHTWSLRGFCCVAYRIRVEALLSTLC